MATLPMSLNPLTSSTVTTTTAADGLFCPSQGHAGAFGQADGGGDHAERIAGG